MTPRWEIVVCDVCRLLDGDLTPKECRYCGKCKSWICKSDLDQTIRRAKAAAMKMAQNLATHLGRGT